MPSVPDPFWRCMVDATPLRFREVTAKIGGNDMAGRLLGGARFQRGGGSESDPERGRGLIFGNRSDRGCAVMGLWRQRLTGMGSLVVLGSGLTLHGSEDPTVLNLWPDAPPGAPLEVGSERDFTKPTDRLIAGRPIIKLGNVKTPQIHVYRPEAPSATESAVVVCSGGGWSILAWDLEGTEVAAWLNSFGVTAVVLKYRVPTRSRATRWLAPVQDAQRAIRLTRLHARSWRLRQDRIGILGFSAGGHTAAMAALLSESAYKPVDRGDEFAHRPDFAALIYPGGLVTQDYRSLREDVPVPSDAPPLFFAHAFDDRVRIENSLLLALELKRHKIPFDLHIYSEGGHGYGLRETQQPVTGWPQACRKWMGINGWLD